MSRDTWKICFHTWILYWNFPPSTFAVGYKICLPLSHFITLVLQIFYSEIKPLTWYDLVNYNHTLYHSIEICPIVNLKETPLTQSVFIICKTGIDILVACYLNKCIQHFEWMEMCHRGLYIFFAITCRPFHPSVDID